MAFTFTINGNTYSSDPNSGVADGYRFFGYGYITALANLAVDMVAVAGQALGYAGDAANQVALATAQANAAATSAASAVAAPGTSATSATPLTIAPGVQNLTIQTGKSLVGGMSVMIASTATPTIWMFGNINSYNPATGALAVTVTATKGTGTLSAWTVSLSGIAGPSVAPPLLKVQRAGDVQLTTSDLRKLIEYTSGTFNQTSATPLALGDGWHCWIRNRGGGMVTYGPPTGLVNGVAKLVIDDGETYLLQCDSTNITAVLVEDANDSFKYLAAGDAIPAGTMAEFNAAGAAIPWNTKLTTAVGQVAFALGVSSGVESALDSCVLSDGRIVVVGSAAGATPKADVYDKYGQFLSTITLDVSGGVDSGRPMAVAATNNGGFVVAWRRNTDGYGMYTGYSSTLTQLYGATVQVAAASEYVAIVPLNATNEYLIIRQAGAGGGVSAYKFNMAGVLQGGANLLYTDTQNLSLRAAMLTSGNFVVVSDSAGAYIYARRFNTAYVQQGGTITVVTGSPQFGKVVVSPGKFAVFYRTTYNGGANSSLRGMVYNDAGTVATAEVNITASLGVIQVDELDACWNGTNYAVAFRSGTGVKNIVLSSLLVPSVFVDGGSTVNASVACEATTRGDYFAAAGYSNTNRYFVFSSLVTNLAGVSTGAVAAGALGKFRTRGIASLVTKAAANIDFDHTAKTPPGVKGSIYNYAALLTA